MNRARDYRYSARQVLKGFWVYGALLVLLYGLLSSISAVTLIGAIIIIPVIEWSFAVAFLKLGRGGGLNAGDLFFGFNDYGRILGTMLLTELYTFFWSLLFVIPGIIKTYSYSMVPYILVDNPNVKFSEAITMSREMMNGKKWRLFCLELSFIGWILLIPLTFGIGSFFVMSYIQTAMAAFYEDNK